MLNKEAIEAYNTYTSTASNLVRQLALAGIAVIWIFAIVARQHVSLPGTLLPPLLCLIATLFLDLLQYYVAASVWDYYIRLGQKKYRQDKGEHPALEANIPIPRKINWPTYMFFYLKGAFLFLGFVLLGIEVVRRMSCGG